MTETAPDGLRLTIDTDPPDSFRATLLDQIGAHNAATVPGHISRFSVMLRGADGVLAGGLSGSMYWDWLFVAALWVDAGHRGTGAGTALLIAAERHARAAGCHSVWLDTFQARGFYEKHGYTVFGTLDDYPKGHTRAFLRKHL
jgi:GNAT superfamily N-acetyltransferase